MAEIKFTDQQLLDAYLSQGLGATRISKLYNVSKTAVLYRVAKLKQNGLIPLEFCHPPHGAKGIDADFLIEDFKSGMGLLALAGKYGITRTNVKRHLAKAKERGFITQAECECRCNARVSSDTRLAFRRRRWKNNFNSTTKRAALTRERSLCEWCHLAIEGGWRAATYHHRVPIRFGGDKSLGNCTVLHRKCHKEHFLELHGFRYSPSKKAA